MWIKKLKFDLGREENIVGKGANAGYQHFLLFSHNVFQRASFLGSLKAGIVLRNKSSMLLSGKKFNFNNNYHIPGGFFPEDDRESANS